MRFLRWRAQRLWGSSSRVKSELQRVLHVVSGASGSTFPPPSSCLLAARAQCPPRSSSPMGGASCGLAFGGSCRVVRSLTVGFSAWRLRDRRSRVSFFACSVSPPFFVPALWGASTSPVPGGSALGSTLASARRPRLRLRPVHEGTPGRTRLQRSSKSFEKD